MRWTALRVASIVALCPSAALAQSPRAATYITDEEVKTVNRQPGIDAPALSRLAVLGGDDLVDLEG